MFVAKRCASSGDVADARPTEKTNMKLMYIGRQGSCRYYWRIFRGGWKIMYAKVDGGTLQPLA